MTGSTDREASATQEGLGTAIPSRPERLQRFLARCGVASRRASERLIASGRVSVNGAVVIRLGSSVDADRDEVELDGRQVRPSADKVYLVLNKPRGVVSSANDSWGRQTVLDLVAGDDRLFPVGRLDADSEGLILLTNDGELAQRLMHPRYGSTREYRVLVDISPSVEALAALSQGVLLDDGLTMPADVQRLGRGDGGEWLTITLREGRKRQVRRMFASVGSAVKRLQRTRIGPLSLGTLESGAWRPLSRTEVLSLKSAVGVAE